MKISKMVLCILLSISLLLPYIPFAYAVEKPDYVGFNEGDEFIWTTTFDKGPVEDYLEDRGYSEAYAENFTDWYFDINDWDDDTVAWKIIIIEFIETDDTDWNGLTDDDEDDVDYLKYKYSIWETEDLADNNAWDDIDKSEKARLYEAEEVVYSDIAYYGDGLFMRFFVPKNLKWDKIKSNLNDYYEDKNLDDEYDASTETVTYFFTEKAVGLKVIEEEEHNDDVDEFETIARYNDNGIAYYLEWSYDGEPIYKFELSTYGQSRVYFIENWWWMSLIAIGVIAGLIVLIVLIKKR